MKTLLFLLFTAVLISPHQAAAHGDHEYQEPRAISEAVAFIVAQRASISMSRKDAGLGFGQLSESWSAVPDEDLSMHKKGAGYYVVSVFNKSENQTLYILMSETGDVYDANLIGIFDGIE